MRENGESLRSLPEGEAENITSESKMKSPSPDGKLSLPSIHPTVIQALPSGEQALPSLQPTEPFTLPKLHSKGKKKKRKPKSAAKQKLPTIPEPEKLTLPSVQANVATSAKKALPVEDQAKAPDTKARSAVKPVRRMLPSIPSLAGLNLANIEPIEVQAEPKVILVPMRRRRRHLPILPTIIEQRTPTPTPTPPPTKKGVEPEEIGASQKPEKKVKEGVASPRAVVEEPQKSLQKAESEALPTKKEELDSAKPKASAQKPRKISKGTQTTPQSEAKEKDALPSPQPVVKETQKSLHPARSETLPSKKEELQGAKPKPKAASQRPTKVSIGLQTNLQSAEEKVMPSLKPIKEKHPEDSGVRGGLLPKSPAKTESKAKQPSGKDTLKSTSVQGNGKPVSQQPGKEEPCDVKVKQSEPSQRSKPSVEQEHPTRPMTRSARTTRQMAKAKELSVPPLTLEHNQTGRQVKVNTQGTKAEPASNIKGKVKQTKAPGDAVYSPQQTVEHKPPKPPAPRGKPMASVPGKVRQAQEKNETVLSPQHAAERKISRPPPGARFSPKATKAESLGCAQGPAMKTQAMGETPLCPRPPPPRRNKVSPPKTEVGTLKSAQGALKDTQAKAEVLMSPRPPPARRNKVSPPRPEGEAVKKVQGTFKETQAKSEALMYPISSPARFTKFSPPKTEAALEKTQGALKETQTKPEAQLGPKPPPARRTRVSPPKTKGEALENTQGPFKETQAKGEALLYPRPPPPRRTKVSPPKTEREVLENFHGAQTQAKNNTLLTPQRSMERMFPILPDARQAKASPPVAELDAVASLPTSKRETPPYPQPKPGSYAYLNLKRREFEELQRLQLLAKQFRGNSQPVEKEGQSRDLLTVKPALPAIQSTQESAAVLKPHPPAPTTKKGLPNARPIGKRPHPKDRAKLVRELPSLQLTVKQVLPSISSSNTLVKHPFPSVQPEGQFTEETDAQLPGMGRQ